MANADHGTSRLSFPHRALTRIEGKPTAITVTNLRKEIYANAQAIPSLGSGEHGFLGLVMDPAAYFARTGTVFVVPIYPGIQANHAAGLTGPQITAANRAYDAALNIFEKYAAVKKELCGKILSALDKTYFDELEDVVFGFTDVTSLQLLNHLQINYATLSPDNLEINRMSLTKVWTPKEPISKLWTRIKYHKEIAAAGNEPLADGTVI